MGLGFEPWTERWKAITNPLATELWAFAPVHRGYYLREKERKRERERAVSFFGLRKRVCYDSKKTWEKVSLKENLGVCKKRRERRVCECRKVCVCVCVCVRERERERKWVCREVTFWSFRSRNLDHKMLVTATDAFGPNTFYPPHY